MLDCDQILTGKQRRHVTIPIARGNRHHLPSLAVCALAPDIHGSGTQRLQLPHFNLFVANARQAPKRLRILLECQPGLHVLTCHPLVKCSGQLDNLIGSWDQPALSTPSCDTVAWNFGSKIPAVQRFTSCSSKASDACVAFSWGRGVTCAVHAGRHGK